MDPPRQTEGRWCKVYSIVYNGVIIQNSDCKINDIYFCLLHRSIDYSEHELVTFLEQSLLRVRILEYSLIVKSINMSMRFKDNRFV